MSSIDQLKIVSLEKENADLKAGFFYYRHLYLSILEGLNSSTIGNSQLIVELNNLAELLDKEGKEKIASILGFINRKDKEQTGLGLVKLLFSYEDEAIKEKILSSLNCFDSYLAEQYENLY